MNKELLRDAIAVMETWWAKYPQDMSASDRAVLTRMQAEIDAPEPYDQQAFELCDACGWKALIPGDCCLNCTRPNPEQGPFGWYSAKHDEFMLHLRKTEHERLGSYTSKVGGFDAPLYTKPQPADDLTDDEILKVFATCHAGKVYPQDFTCGPKAMRLTEGRAVLAAQKGKS